MPPTTSSSRQMQGGRIRPQQRETNDLIPKLLGADLLPLPEGLLLKVNETKKHSMKDTCRRDYRNRIKKIIDFWKVEDPQYYEIGVRNVPTDEYEDESNYFFPNSNRSFNQDMIYEGFTEMYLLHFFAPSKVKQDGTLVSVGHLRKYKDVVAWGAS